jgi:hypothetical protein
MASNDRVPPQNYWHFKLKNVLKNLLVGLRVPFARKIQVTLPITFVAGCGHSGTTVVAARMGCHPEVFLLGRETGLVRKHYRIAYATVVAQEWAFFALHLGRSQILEKTPRHIYTIPVLKRLIPHAHFILVVRNPLDTVASLFKRYNSLDSAINRWLLDNEQLLRHSRLPNTKTVYYEEMTENPEETFKDIADFMGLEWSDQILEAGNTEYQKFDTGGLMALRGQQVSQPIHPNRGKWRSALTSQQADRVVNRTRQLALALGYTEADLR